MKLTADQLAQVREEHRVFVEGSTAARDAVRTLEEYFEHRNGGPFTYDYRGDVARLEEQIAPAEWAREHGRALLDTIAALERENAALRASIAPDGSGGCSSTDPSTTTLSATRYLTRHGSRSP